MNNHLELPAPQAIPRRRHRTSREHRRLAEVDRSGAMLAGLHEIRSGLQRARTVIDDGWIQRTLFTHQAGPAGSLEGACLVGAVIHAGGGPMNASSQPVQRSLDVTWHALHRDEREPIRWCPGPALRRCQVADLTRWNDYPGRAR